MVDAPPLRQVAGLQRVDEAAPPRDLHENGEAWGDTDTMPPRDLQLVHRLYLPISPHISAISHETCSSCSARARAASGSVSRSIVTSRTW